MTDDPAQVARPVSSSKVVRSARAEALLGSAPADQIAEALATEKWARAADLIAHFGERLLLEEGTRGLSAHLAALPEAEVAKNPRVAVIYAWVNVYEQRYYDARQRLSQAERAQKQLDLTEVGSSEEVELTPNAELKQSLATLRLHLQAVSEGRLPQDVADIMIPASADHPLWRAGALVILGRCRLHAGELGAAREDLEAAQILAQTARGNRAQRTAAEATVMLGAVAEANTALGEAHKRYAEVALRTEETLAPHVAAAEVGKASLALARLELDAATTAIARARSLATSLPEGTFDPFRLTFDLGLVEAWTHTLGGDFDAARAVLDQIERALTAVKIRWPLDLLGIERAHLALLRGDESTAKRWLQQRTMREGQGRTPTRPVEAMALLMSARVRLTLHQADEAKADANAVLAFAEAKKHRRLAADALVLLSLAHFAAGERDGARSALIAALEATEAERLGLPFAQRGLVDMAAELGVEHTLLTQAAAYVPSVTAPPRDRPGARVTASGPIETAQVPASTDAEPTDAEPTEVSLDAEPAEEVTSEAPAEAAPVG